ncbi:hypothetical protein O9929_17810 [Vibrio lentus]|nr:hypothetical protein [Vibrio lentus]
MNFDINAHRNTATDEDGQLEGVTFTSLWGSQQMTKQFKKSAKKR